LTQTDEVDAAAKVIDCYEHLLKIFVDLEILHVICRWLPVGQRDMREAVGKQRLDETLALMVVSDHRGVAVKQGTPSTRDGRIGIVVMPLVSWIWLKSGALRHHWRIYAPTPDVWTDDAYVRVHYATIAPRVPGQFTSVRVDDNDTVKAGQVLAELDDRDFRVALEQAQARVAAAHASIENIDAQLDVQQAQIAANQAQVDQAQAALVFAQQQAARYQTLARDGSGTVQNAQRYTSGLAEQQAALVSAQATLKLAQRQVEALKAQRSSAVDSFAHCPTPRFMLQWTE
jgi:multidrug resistance efflux pump